MIRKFPLVCKLTAVVIILLVFVCSTDAQSVGQQDSLDKVKVLQRVGSDWLDIGTQAYRRGFFIESEKALLRAREYFLYLNNRQREKLEEYSDKAHEKALRLRRLRGQLERVDFLLRQGELSRADMMLSKIEADHPVPKVITQELAALKKRLNRKIQQHKSEMKELYTKSIAQYRRGDFEQAREGFSRLAESEFFEPGQGLSPREYLRKIELSENSGEHRVSEQQDEKESGQTAEVNEPEADGMLDMAVPDESKPESSNDRISRQENIRRSYARAVVTDAVDQAEKLLKNGQYYKASQSVEKAKRIIEKHRDYLGEGLYQDFLAKLEQMNENIVRQRERWLGARDANNPWRM